MQKTLIFEQGSNDFTNERKKGVVKEVSKQERLEVYDAVQRKNGSTGKI